MPNTPALLSIALIFFCASAGTAAQAKEPYPSQPVRVVVPFPPGAGVDIVLRLVAEKLTLATGESFIVENHSGAAGNIGAAYAARATPDGYTLFGTPSSIAEGPALFKNLTFQPARDFRGIALLASVPFVLVINPKVPATSVAELVARAKAKPGSLTFGSTGAGGSPHLTGEMFKMQAGIDIRHVPYRGTATALTDLISGQINMMFANVLSVLPQIQAGRLKALAITSTKRSASLPDLPTMAEAGLPGFESETWFALLAPTGTPPGIINRLNAITARIMQMPDIQKTLALQGATVQSSTPAQVDAYLQSEITKYTRIIKDSGTTID